MTDCHSLDSAVYAQNFDHEILVFLKQTQTDAISAPELSNRVELISRKRFVKPCMQKCLGNLYTCTCIYESPHDEWKENTGNYTVYLKVAVTK